MPSVSIYIFLFAMGAVVGSFLNVCIYRIPVGQSIVSPPSACPECGRGIPFYYNIPILSYLLLRGRCRFCGKTIPLRYPAVEFLTAALMLILYLKYGLTFESAVYFILLSSLIVVTFIDLEHQIIPDRISISGILAGIIFSSLSPSAGLIKSLIGVIAGGGILLMVASGYYLITRREGMGFGDIKLLAMIGAFVGWKGVLVTLFAASFMGATTGIALIVLLGKDGRYAIPFGPFLSLGAFIHIFAGERIIRYYLSL